MIDGTSAVYAKNETNYCDQSYQVQIMMKTKQDNKVTDHTCAIYTKNETKLS